jgi:4-amino-4-deoxy-L-arabinose transferase-like glycosyltransferase
MDHQTFTWGRSGNRSRKTERWVDRLWILGLLLAALLLFGINLGGPPLLDWGEGTVAWAARQIAKAPLEPWEWFHPRVASQPFWEAPPLLQILIAGAYKLGGFNEWTTRLPSAILSALSVPLLYAIGREIFPSRQAALFSSLIYLTLLPFVGWGRLAIADGSTLCFVMLMMWGVLRSRRDLRASIGVGLGLGLIALSKGLLIGCLLLSVALVFLAWDTPRLLTSMYWWSGVFLGSAPGLAWYVAWGLHNSQTLMSMDLTYLSSGHRDTPVTSRHPAWYSLIQVVKFAIPWLLFWPFGLRFAWDNRIWGWAKLVLIWSGAYMLVLLVLINKLPWYGLPLYPTLALASGAFLADIWNGPSRKAYPRLWSIGLIVLSIAAMVGSIAFAIVPMPDRSLSVIFACVALTAITAAVLVLRHDLQFILILFWGMYISLLLFMTSPYWIWELEASYPVKEVAAILNRGTPPHQTIYASFPSERPALKFYSDRQVIPQTKEELQRHWQQEKHPYLLLDAQTLERLEIKAGKRVGQTSGWVLLTK